jgi:hypothetical protein
MDEERKAAKEKEEAAVAAATAAATAAAASIQEIPLETQEQLRDEGRREVEGKIKEAESRHSDVVKELTEQVQTFITGSECLLKLLKSS